MRKKLLLPGQSAFLQAPLLYPSNRFHFNVAGYGAGKTSSLATAWSYWVRALQGRRSKDGHRPRLLLGGVTLSHLKKTTLTYLLETLENSGTKYHMNSKDSVLTVGDVSTSLVSLSQPHEIKGLDVYVSFLDELDDLNSVSNADDTTFEALRACNERTRQRVPGVRSPFLMSATTSQGMKGLYRAITGFKKTGVGYTLVRSSSYDNWYLDPSYVNDMAKTYNKNEKLVWLEGYFLALSQGRVLGDFDWDRNFVNVDMDRQVAAGERVFWTQDVNQGYHRGCAAILRNGIIYVVKSYEFADLRDAPKVVRNDFPRNEILWIPDATAKDQIRMFVRELHKHNIQWIIRSKNPNVEDTAMLTNKLLYTGRMIMTEAAVDHASDAAMAQRDKHGEIPAGKGPTSPIHRIDSLRYLAYFLCCTEASLMDIKRVTIARKLAYTADEPEVTEMSDGFVKINASALGNMGLSR